MIAKLAGLRIYAYVAIAAAVSGFAYGWHLEAKRFAEFRGGVEAIGRAAEKARAERIEQDKAAKRNAEETHARNEKDLRAQLARLSGVAERLRLDNARRSVVPPAPSATESGPGGDDGRICFDREKLREGVDRVLARFGGSLAGFAGRYGQSIERGAGALNAFNTCAEWANKVSGNATDQ